MSDGRRRRVAASLDYSIVVPFENGESCVYNRRDSPKPSFVSRTSSSSTHFPCYFSLFHAYLTLMLLPLMRSLPHARTFSCFTHLLFPASFATAFDASFSSIATMTSVETTSFPLSLSILISNYVSPLLTYVLATT